MMTGLKTSAIVFRLKTDGTYPCPHCGADVAVYLCPDWQAPETYFRVEGTCTCPTSLYEARRSLAAKRDGYNPPAETLEDKIRLMGVPKRFMSGMPYDIFAQYANNFTANLANGSGLYISGEKGSGKTWAACAIIKAIAERGHTARFVEAPDLVERMSAELYSERSVQATIDNLSKVDLLVIDDLGKETMTARSLSNIDRVINARYTQLKPIIITTQLGSVAMKAHWGATEMAESIMSRLYETCMGIDMGHIDRRVA
jgi:hypothetical protein